jgi:hypothetical protein
MAKDPSESEQLARGGDSQAPGEPEALNTTDPLDRGVLVLRHLRGGPIASTSQSPGYPVTPS